MSLMQRLLGDPLMTEHIGGPESQEQLRRRLERYQGFRDTGAGQMFVIVAGPSREAAGSTGYWELKWRGETVWETGWHVLPDFQGQGIATTATALVVEAAAAEGRHRSMHAFPSAANGPSNAVCRKAGLTLLGPCEFEYPKGHLMDCNDWAIMLAVVDETSAGR